MKFRTLGKSIIEVSEVGFGAWGLGGDAYGVIEESQAGQLLEYALEKGINFYDTSELYGNGRSEKIIGKAFREKRKKVVLCSKGGLTDGKNHFDLTNKMTVEEIDKSLNGSLDRLQTDYLDVYLLHSPHVGTDLTDIINLLQKFKSSGKILSYGISARSPQDALLFTKKYSLEVIQINYNMIDLRAEESGFLDYAWKNKIGIIGRTPPVFGYLTGALNGSESLDKNLDHRANWSVEQLKKWSESSNLFQFLVNKDRSLVQSALKFCLAQESMSCVIPGVMKKSEIDENVASVDKQDLNAQEVDSVRKINKEYNFIIKKNQ